MTKREAQCPRCLKYFIYEMSSSKPFCSSQCQIIDLGHWINEDYRIPAQEILKHDPSNGEGE